MRRDILKRVEDYVKKRDIDGFRRLAAAYPKNETILMAYSAVAKITGNVDEAIVILNNVIMLNGSRKAEAYLELAKIYKERKEYDFAECLLNMVNSPVLLAEVCYEQAVIYMDKKQFGDAFKTLKQLETTPYHKYYHEGLGRLYYLENRFKLAKEHLDQSAVTMPSKIRKILVDTRLGAYDQALDSIKNIQKTEYKNYGNLLAANVYIKLKNYKQALTVLSSLLDTKFKYAALYRIGFIMAMQRRYTESANCINKVYEENLNSKGGFYSEHIKRDFLLSILLISLIKNKEYDKAIQIIEKEKLVVNNQYSYYSRLYSFCCRMSGKPMNWVFDEDKLSYAGLQSYSYSTKAAKRHIYRGHIMGDFASHTLLKNRDLDELFAFVLKNKSENNRVETFDFHDVYCIDYPNAGYENEDSLIAVFNPGTDEIITIYPVLKKDYIANDKSKDDEAKGILPTEDVVYDNYDEENLEFTRALKLDNAD